MKNTSFLSVAGTRTAHLRELSHHLRCLECTSATLREVDDEIPDLEMAMAVYRRLETEGDDETGATAFLSIAESRAEHLRQLSHHMHSMEWVHVSLSAVESEIPQLDVAMAVFGRLMGDGEGSARGSGRKAAAPAEPPPAATETVPEDGSAPSFSQFVSTHLDPAAH